MPAEEEDLVTNVVALVTIVVKIMDPFIEALPLRLGTVRIKLVIGGVFPVYQPKVVLSL